MVKLNKKKDKPTKARIILISIILLIDIFILPWLIKLPFFLADNFETALKEWTSHGIINAFKDMIYDEQIRSIFLVLQVAVFALILGIAWNTQKFSKRNKIGDGVGGPEASGNGEHGTSRWMTEREKDDTADIWYTHQKLNASGIIFGMDQSKKGEKIWLDKDDTHTLIIGATRSGKSRKILLPTIWETAKAGESMIIGDPKGELFITTKDYLENEGYNVITLNLREPLKGNQWNMLDLVNKAVDENNIPKATELAWDIASTITKQTPATSSEPIWQNGEESTIASLILLTVLESDFKFQRHMATAYYLLAEYGQPLADESIPLLDYIKTLPVKHPAKSAFATASIAPYKTRASFFTTALSDLRLFSDPNIADMTSKQDHSLQKIGIDKTAVFLVVPDEKTTRNVLATLYIDQVYQSLVELANKNGGRIPRRVNFILDEFGNLPSVPEFDKKLTVAGGRGMRFTIAVQDVTQLKKLYDKNAQTITGNCHNWIYIRTADQETSKLISDLTGKYTIDSVNKNSSIQSKGHSFSMGLGTTGRPLLMPDEIRRWDNNESLVLRVGHFTARYPLPDLSLYMANRELGLSCSSHIGRAKNENQEIIMERWNNIKVRELEETQIWLPDIDFSNPQYGNNSVSKNKAEVEVAVADEQKINNEEDDKSNNTALSMDDVNLNDILKINASNQSNDEVDDDFL